VLARDADPTQFALWTTVVIATPPAMYAFGQPFKYARLALAPAGVIEQVVLSDRTFFVVYGMLAMALLAAMTWEALFPDRTDQEIMGALPVRPRTVAAARLAAALMMAGAFALALNVPTALLFSLTATTHPAMGFLPVVLFAHLLSTMAACMAVFVILLVVRGTVAFAFGADVADRLATVLQLVAVIAMVEIFFYLPSVIPLLVRRMLEGGDAVRWMPATWFVALYSWIAGSPREVLADQAARGVLFLLGAAALVVPIYTLAAPVMARRALESQSRQRPGPLARVVRSAGHLALHPATRAVAAFTITTLWRSRRHLLIVVSYAGAGVAIAAIGVIAARLRAGLLSAEVSTAVLAVPLVMMFFVTLGLRAAFRLPSELDANWPFRLSPPSPLEAAAGTRLALLVLAIVPLSLLFAIGATALGYPPSTVTALVVFDLAAGWLLLEAALYGWATVPFACAHVPSEETARMRWLIYLIPLNIFAFRGAGAQEAALDSPRGVAIYLAVIVAMALAFRAARVVRARRDTIIFEMPPDQRLGVLNLSEALQ
jgi:hypothetical protein